MTHHRHDPTTGQIYLHPVDVMRAMTAAGIAPRDAHAIIDRLLSAAYDAQDADQAEVLQ